MPIDKSKFIESFKAETHEHLQKLSLGLLKLEKNPQDRELLNTLMREAHTIKGSAVMMGYKRIGELSHEMEECLEKTLLGQIALEKTHIDALLKCLDAIEPLLDDKVTWSDKGIARPFAENLVQETAKTFAQQENRSACPASAPQPGSPTPPVFDAPVKEITDKASQVVRGPEQEGSVRVGIAKLDRMMNLSGELFISRVRLSELVSNLTRRAESQPLEASAEQDLKALEELDHTLGSLIASMQDQVMGVRMLPVGTLFNTFPRAMRDLAQQKDKRIRFELTGEETELDKAILDELKDPVMHLLRNAVDHGIEPPAERARRQKPEEGTIRLSAYRQGSQVVIEVSDDGGGIDVPRIRETAVKRGFVAKDRISQIPDEQIIQLIFSPGFTTAGEVTETSGRGVGLDVVTERVGKLKGLVEVCAEPAGGTRFVLRLPLTLAVTESLLVAAGTEVFAVPIEGVVETVRIAAQDIRTVETKEAITVRGHILPLVRLADLFSLGRKGIAEQRYFPVVIIQAVEKRVALLVDKLMGRIKTVTKGIGDPLGKAPNLSGASILGNGKVILIVDVASVIESSEGALIRRPASAPAPARRIKKKKTVLLAEDVLSTALLEKKYPRIGRLFGRDRPRRKRGT